MSRQGTGGTPSANCLCVEDRVEVDGADAARLTLEECVVVGVEDDGEEVEEDVLDKLGLDFCLGEADVHGQICPWGHVAHTLTTLSAYEWWCQSYFCHQGP